MSFYSHKNLSRVERKTAFCICENKDTDQLRGNREADQRLCFRIRIVQFLYYLKPKFQASSILLLLYSPVCVGPGRKPEDRFSQNEALFSILYRCVNVMRPKNVMTNAITTCAAPDHLSKRYYCKVPKFWDARNLCCNLPKLQRKRPNLIGYFVKMVQME